MPLYQYHCRSCGQDFQHTEPLREHGHTRTACPTCLLLHFGHAVRVWPCSRRGSVC